MERANEQQHQTRDDDSFTTLGWEITFRCKWFMFQEQPKLQFCRPPLAPALCLMKKDGNLFFLFSFKKGWEISVERNL